VHVPTEGKGDVTKENFYEDLVHNL